LHALVPGGAGVVPEPPELADVAAGAFGGSVG